MKNTRRYNYSKLLGRMRECRITQEQLAKEIGKNESTLSAKLNNRSQFNAEEMDAICKVLDIPGDEISTYFFAT